MKIGQNIQCQACGASSVTKLEDQSMLECQYCGAMMTFSEDSKIPSTVQLQHKPAKLGLLLVMIPTLVIALMVIFWLVFQNIRKNRSMDSYEAEISHNVATVVDEKVEHPLLPLETINSPPTTDYNQSLTIQSQVAGETTNGGKYWILGVKNSSDQQIARPGVMLSLFDQHGKRIEEQGGWSLREILEAGEQTAILLYLNEPPTDTAKQQITTFASQPTQLGLNQIEVKVLDYTVSTKNKQFELIGDVINDQDSPVKYVRLVAVAYNVVGEPIGIGNAFSTDKNLAPNQRSGFKVKVGTFLQGEPVTWRVWALGRS